MTPPRVSTIVLEALEVDHHVVLDVEAVELAEDRLDRVEAARLVVARERVGPVPGVEPEAVDLAGVGRPEDRPGRAGRDRHVDDVAREAEHRHLLRLRVDRHDDQRVGVEGAFLRPLVGADQQDVQPALAVPLGQRRGRQRRPERRLADRRRRGVWSGLGIRAAGRGRRGPGLSVGLSSQVSAAPSGAKMQLSVAWASAPLIGDERRGRRRSRGRPRAARRSTGG